MATEESVPELSFTEAVLGQRLLGMRWLKRLAALPPSWRVAGGVALLASLLYIPYVGAVGLWDPWETHYGEVARMMIQRRDFVYPWWESAWFFSKPPLTMWLQALGMLVVGTNRTEGAVALYTEWGMRMPFVLLSIGALALMALAISRVASRRVAVASAVCLSTMPMYWLLTRQTVTDTPFVCLMMAALSCAMIAQLDDTCRHKSAWWYAFYILCALATLAKGLLGVGLPAVVLILYACLSVLPWNGAAASDHVSWLVSEKARQEVREGKRPMPALWDQLYRMHLGTGLLVFLAVCGPWFALLFTFQGVDDEGKLFWYRFLIHDHVSRLTSGVHTTTPGGSFTYFIEQGGYAIFPWVALVPGAIAVAARARLRGGDKEDHLAVLALVWTVFSFCLVGLSATKFHHYFFPVLPGLAILIGMFVDRLWKEGIPAHAVSLILGLAFFILVARDLAADPKNFTDLFVYNYDRPYPTELVTRPLSLFDFRSLWVGDIFVLLLLVFGAYLASVSLRMKEKSVSSRAMALGLLLGGVALLLTLATNGNLHTLLGLGLALALVVLYVGYEAVFAKGEARRDLVIAAGVVGVVALAGVLVGAGAVKGKDEVLFALMSPVNIKTALGAAFALGGGLCALAAIQRARVMLFGSFMAFTLVFALWFNWSHWVDLSHHWTQRDLFWRYYRMRQPDEPITAFLMNWRGETFYSKNTVKQIKDNAFLGRYAALPGKKWALVEQHRLGALKAAVGPDKTVTPYDRDLNNKFLLVSIE